MSANVRLSAKEKQLVQSSFYKISAIPETIARDFYQSLFLLDPSLERLCKADSEMQGVGLLKMLHLIARGLDDFEELIPVLKECSRRHHAFGIEDGHYDAAEAALLNALEKNLQLDFTPALKQAWSQVCCVVADIMREEAAEAEALEAKDSLH